MADKNLIVPDSDFLARAAGLKEDIYSYYRKISGEDTPRVAADGTKIVDKKGKYDFIIEAYIKERLNFYYPGWSWRDGHIQFLGAEWTIADGTLVIIDEKLIGLGVIPPIREFWATAGHRITYYSERAHDPENIVDIDNDVKSVNTKAFKKAVNSLTGIGDDIYRKRIDSEKAGTPEDLILSGNASYKVFELWLTSQNLNMGQAFKIAGVQVAVETRQYDKAMELVLNGRR